MSNVRLAGDILRSLWSAGVRDIVLCAGARNAPFVACLSADGNPFRVHPFFEERSAGFFRIGPHGGFWPSGRRHYHFWNRGGGIYCRRRLKPIIKASL